MRKIERELPEGSRFTNVDLRENIEQIYRDVPLIFGGGVMVSSAQLFHGMQTNRVSFCIHNY